MGLDKLLNAIKNTPTDPEDDQAFDNEYYTWSFDDFDFEYRMICYCIQKALKSLDKNFFVHEDEVRGDFEYDVDLRETIVLSGIIAFHVGKKNYTLTFDNKISSITLASDTNVCKVKNYFEDYIKFNNPLKRKNLQLYEKSGDIELAFHPITPMDWDSVIIDPVMKQKIWDNTIFQIENLDLNNGLIFYGPQGLGKSNCCKSLIYEASKLGYSTCSISSAIEFTSFGLFLRKYLSPCLVIFEDIDSFACKREEKDNEKLSDFLQLINGLSDDKNKIIFIATTNLLDYLDKSVSDRPMRFNRKFLFDYPAPAEIDKLIELFFKDDGITPLQKQQCYHYKMGGAHIKEIRRTCELLSLLNKKTIKENFDEAVREVKDSFKQTGKVVGFGATPASPITHATPND